MISPLSEQAKDLCDTIRVSQCQRHMMIWWGKDQVYKVGDHISALLESCGTTIREGISNGERTLLVFVGVYVLGRTGVVAPRDNWIRWILHGWYFVHDLPEWIQ